MRISPRALAIVYFIVGGIFFYAAVKSDSNSESLWELSTIVLVIASAFMIGGAIRLLRLYYLIRQHQNKK